MAPALQWPLVVLPAGVLVAIIALCWMLPRLSPSGLLFGVTVGSRTAEGPEGQAAVRLYRLALVSGSWVPVLFWALGLSRGSVSLLVLAALSLAPELLTAYLLGHLRARALAVDPAAVPASPPARVPRPPEPEAGSRSFARTLLGLVPFALLFFAAGWLAADYAALPDPFPVHSGPSGLPDRWMPKSPAVVFLAPGIGFAVLLFLEFIRGVLRSARRAHPGAHADASGRVADDLLLGIGLFIGVLVAAVSLAMGGLLPPQLLMPAVIAAPLLFLGLLLAAVARLIRQRRDAPPWAGDGTPDSAWKGGMFYVNRNDPALVVPKRFGIGWTLNFGRPAAWLLLAVLLAVPLAISLGALLAAR
jgi:uncharacterized membrane protein